MQLEPCAGCRRHVAITESVCPFCARALDARAPRSSTFGRMSRAAVFAGAALATTACGKKAKQPDTKTTTQQQPDTSTTTPPDAPAPEPAPDRVVPDDPVRAPYGAPPARRRYV